MDIDTHVFRAICASNAPSWCSVALIPESAMKRNGLPSFKEEEPACTDAAFQNFVRASVACPDNFTWSMILVIRMYQEPMDMIAMMISVPLATKSPVFHNASRPYGFSITSFAGADASVAGAVAEAAGAAVDAAEAGSSAKTGAATVALNARRAVARNAEKRDFIFILPYCINWFWSAQRITPGYFYLHQQVFQKRAQR